MNKNSPFTSIILLSYDNTQTMREVTRAAIESIVKYTNEEDYELIWLDVIPIGAESLGFNKHYDDTVFHFNKRDDRRWQKIFCNKEQDPGQYACWNMGAKLAKGDYLCFYQNDVFVHEGWLDNMTYYLRNNFSDVVFPDQRPKPRNFVLGTYSYHPRDVKTLEGARDAGILLITKAGFDKTGGWNEKLKVHFGEADMYARISNVGLRQVFTNKTMILHLEHGSGWEKKLMEKDKYEADETISAKIVQGIA